MEIIGTKIQTLRKNKNITQAQLAEASAYSDISAVVGAAFPGEAQLLHSIMKNNFFLVPGFGAQGGEAKDVIPCFNEDGLGAIVSSSRNVLYKHLETAEYDGTQTMYVKIVRSQAKAMQEAVYQELSNHYPNKEY